MSKGKTLKDYPNILKQWDYEKNGSVDPLIVPSKSNKQYYWICEKGHESYICSVEKKVGRLFGCPICSNHKIAKGINDFESKHPELMDNWYWELNDNENIIPSKLGPVSSHLAWWKCQKCGGVWKASISNRVRMHSGCPYCANLKVKKGYNDLLTLRPELAEEWDYEKNGDLKPDEVVALSSRKIWWKCEKGHSWQATPNQRVKTNCPYCSNHKVFVGYNDFAAACPKEASQWDYEKNGDKLPIHYTRGSETRVWWKCEKGHSWRARIAERGRGQGCPICSNQKVLIGYNDLASTNPELIKEWDYSNNSISPQEITSGSNKRVWWICEKCGHSWKSIVSTRVKGYGCPKCGAERSTIGRLKTMAKNNGLFKRFPDLIKEWDFEKNKHIDITLLAASSNKFAWWKCEKGHSYRTRICSRTLHGVGCPYCHNQKVLKGINDLQTLNPVLAEEWDFEKNAPLTPSDVFSHASRSVWWKCPICGHSWKSKINNRANARGCPNCSQAGTSFIEQSLFFYISKCFLDAKNRYKYDDKYELDIYIPSLNTAIEYDGFFYHSVKNSATREKNKDLFCQKNGIKLIRLREEPLSFTEHAINISCDCKNWPNTENTIKTLLTYLGVDNIPDICLKRDLPNIVTSKRKLLKEKSIVFSHPSVVEEWDYEKNIPLAPEYFSKGSRVTVWWKCKVCGHSWKTAISNRCNGTNCPNCFDKKRKSGLHRTKSKLNV